MPRKTEPAISHRAEWNEDLDLAPGFELPADWGTTPIVESALNHDLEFAQEVEPIRLASSEPRRNFTWDEPERWWEDEKEVA